MMKNLIDPKFKQQNVKNGLDLSQPIYKWMPLKHVITMIKDQKLSIGQMLKWDDVYENYMLKQIFEYHGNMLPGLMDSIQPCLYSQSWSMEEESDALWRIYSKLPSNSKWHKYDDVAIRIETTAQQLYDTIYTEDACMANTYIGKVEYKSKTAIQQWLRSTPINVQSISELIIKDALTKRREFRHENEVRPIIFLSTDDPRRSQEFLKYELDLSIIKSFLIEPRLTSEDAQRIKDKLMKIGIRSEQITQSKLYKLDKIRLQIV